MLVSPLGAPGLIQKAVYMLEEWRWLNYWEWEESFVPVDGIMEENSNFQPQHSQFLCSQLSRAIPSNTLQTHRFAESIKNPNQNKNKSHNQIKTKACILIRTDYCLFLSSEYL